MTGRGSEEVHNTISGGNQYGPVLMGRDFYDSTFVIIQAAAAPVALAQLPPLTAGFTGREAELAQVAGLLDPGAGAGAVVVSAVAGLAGVGKTALAVHAAHAAREVGWFAGGVVFIDLHGYESSRVQPGQALDALLRALGIPGEHIPEGVEQRAGLYRSALAEIKDPVLIIADNASSEAQVRLLLPGPGPHRVIITSRHTLAGLGARLLDVTVLDQAAGVRLLDEAVRAARPDDERISSDPAAACGLAETSDCLPLALQIMAALLVADPPLTAKELATRMADEVRRLDALRYDDGSGVSAPSVAAAFELSYRQLDEDAARMFRLLPADPGPDVSTGAAAELADWPTERSRAAIGRLVRAHLVEPAGGPSRWRMHDLLRLYARQMPSTSPSEREEAFDRILAWYLRQARAADQHLRALAGAPVPPDFIGRDAALAWLDDHRPNLIAAVTRAAATGRAREAMLLPLHLSEYLEWRRRLDDWLAVLAISRENARQLDHKGNAAVALTTLGNALRHARRFEEAIDVCREAAAVYQETGDRSSEAAALNNLGIALREVRRFDEAVGVCQDAAAIMRETGDRHREGVALNNLSIALHEARRFDEAVGVFLDVAAIMRETGDRHREGMTLNNLSIALRHVGRFEEAVGVCQDAAAIYRETGDRHGEGMALNSLSIALQEVRRFEEAATTCRDAVAIMRETGDRHGEGMALNSLSIAFYELRRFEEAARVCRDAVALYRETGDQHSAGESLDYLGSFYLEMGRPSQAAACWRDSAAAMRDAGDPQEAERLEQLSVNVQIKLDHDGGRRGDRRRTRSAGRSSMTR